MHLSSPEVARSVGREGFGAPVKVSPPVLYFREMLLHRGENAMDRSVVLLAESDAEMGCSDFATNQGVGIPPCEFLLVTDKGRATYRRLAALLALDGTLASETHLRLSRYALLIDSIHKAQAEGRQLRASWFDQMRRAEQSLGLRIAPKPPSPIEPRRPNRYARCGFPNRLR